MMMKNISTHLARVLVLFMLMSMVLVALPLSASASSTLTPLEMCIEPEVAFPDGNSNSAISDNEGVVQFDYSNTIQDTVGVTFPSMASDEFAQAVVDKYSNNGVSISLAQAHALIGDLGSSSTIDVSTKRNVLHILTTENATGAGSPLYDADWSHSFEVLHDSSAVITFSDNGVVTQNNSLSNPLLGVLGGEVSTVSIPFTSDAVELDIEFDSDVSLVSTGNDADSSLAAASYVASIDLCLDYNLALPTVLDLVKEVQDPATGTWYDAQDADTEEWPLHSDGSTSKFRYTISNISISNEVITNVVLSDSDSSMGVAITAEACEIATPDLQGATVDAAAAAALADNDVAALLPKAHVITCEFSRTAEYSESDGDLYPANGTYRNLASVTGDALNSDGVPVELADEDEAHVVIPVALIDVEKLTNGVQADDADAEDIPVLSDGDVVTWTYIVTNTGTDNLVDIVLGDDKEGSVDLSLCDGYHEPLLPGESFTCEVTGVAGSSNYDNLATVTAQGEISKGSPGYDPDTDSVSDTDPSRYAVTSPVATTSTTVPTTTSTTVPTTAPTTVPTTAPTTVKSTVAATGASDSSTDLAFLAFGFVLAGSALTVVTHRRRMSEI